MSWKQTIETMFLHMDEANLHWKKKNKYFSGKMHVQKRDKMYLHWQIFFHIIFIMKKRILLVYHYKR